MQAASCGKHIFSSLHARDAASVVTSLRDFTIDNRSLACNVRAIISQRLVRRICNKCGSTRELGAPERELFASAGIEPPDRIPQAVGCDACRKSGYFDRIGVFEMAVIQPEIAAAIMAGKGEHELRQLMSAAGAVSLMADGLQKVRAGVTTLEEVQSMCWLRGPDDAFQKRTM